MRQKDVFCSDRADHWPYGSTKPKGKPLQTVTIEPPAPDSPFERRIDRMTAEQAERIAEAPGWSGQRMAGLIPTLDDVLDQDAQPARGIRLAELPRDRGVTTRYRDPHTGNRVCTVDRPVRLWPLDTPPVVPILDHS